MSHTTHIIHATTPSSEDIQIEFYDIYKVYRVENIKEYQHVDFNSWKITRYTDAIDNASIQNIYLCIDTFYENAFSHWVYECAIYLPLFQQLKQKYPHCKLYLRSQKMYKTLFCNYFNITPADIVYEFDTNVSSIYYFPSPISALNETTISNEYISHVNLFSNIFKDQETNIEYTLAILPRQSKENFKNNDRVIDFDPILQYAIHIDKSIVIYTDTIIDLQDQIDSIQKSKTIVLTDGSPFLVNGMFAYNTQIIVAGKLYTQMQSQTYKKMDYITRKITEQNLSVVYEENIEKAVDILSVTIIQ